AILSTHTLPDGLPTEAAYTAAFGFSAGAALLAFLAAILVPRPATLRRTEELDRERAAAGAGS
ncbi:MAG TPA: MFS transporter, partial [Actinomycetes bacterium]